MNYDFNQDGILSFREILTFLEDHFNHVSHYFQTGPVNPFSMNIDALIAECGGEGCDWVHNNHVVAKMLSAGVNMSSYESLYNRMAAIHLPWATDMFFTLGESGMPATLH